MTTPPDTNVKWGALDLGTAPIDHASVPCGAATVTLSHPRYQTITRALDATADAPAALTVTLQRPTVILNLRSVPPGATFTVNGAGSGRAPTTMKVPGFEPLHVTATLAGYQTWHGSAKVMSGSGVVVAKLVRAPHK